MNIHQALEQIAAIGVAEAARRELWAIRREKERLTAEIIARRICT